MNEGGHCSLAGQGRGDCTHAVGLPGISKPGQHDGPDDTVDAYGKPNGWCWYCWQSYQLMTQHVKIKRLKTIINKLNRNNGELNGTHLRPPVS